MSIGYGYQRRALLRRLGELAAVALDQVEAELGDHHTAKARDAAVVAGIVLDKAELLAKATGPEVEQPDAAEALGRLRELAADLAARRGPAGAG